MPSFEFNSDQPLIPATAPFNESVPVEFSIAPANFSFPADIQLEVNTQSSILSLHFSHFKAQVFDLQTDMEVATGSLPSFTLPAKSFPVITVPLNFSYVADNTSDQTCKSMMCPAFHTSKSHGNFRGELAQRVREPSGRSGWGSAAYVISHTTTFPPLTLKYSCGIPPPPRF